MTRLVVTGTGTDIGKTVLAAGLCRLLDADYWKPVQTGADRLRLTDPGQPPSPDHPYGPDALQVRALTGARLWPEAWQLVPALSPHRAAELDGVAPDPALLTPPAAPRLVVEGAGGVLVPVTRHLLSANLFARWQLPVVLTAATGLGTISHTLTALESLRARGVCVLGVAFVGDDNPDNIDTIAQLSGARVLGRLPRLDPLTPQALAGAMRTHFRAADFAGPGTVGGAA